MFLYYFDMLISKIIFNKIKKFYFDGFLKKKNTLNYHHYHNSKHTLIMKVKAIACNIF
jgi:uncharacterized protein YjlB